MPDTRTLAADWARRNRTAWWERPRCIRCGDQTTDNDVAEVAAGPVHQSCMRPGEEIA